MKHRVIVDIWLTQKIALPLLCSNPYPSLLPSFRFLAPLMDIILYIVNLISVGYTTGCQVLRVDVCDVILDEGPE